MGEPYARPEVLVSADWVQEHRNDPSVRIVESDEDVLLYDMHHIPGAVNFPWGKAVNEDGTFKSKADLQKAFADVGIDGSSPIITYCRIGERSSHTWFVLQHLLGFEKVRNYDGSWTEWGSAVRVPIVTGGEPGEVPA